LLIINGERSHISPITYHSLLFKGERVVTVATVRRYLVAELWREKMEKMKLHYPIEKIRNIGIVAHIDAGKTTATERILYYTGKISRIGEVDEGTAVMDWMEQEKERGITITSAVTTCFWRDCCINIIDTPGHVDFTVEVERTLRVLDGVVIIFCGVGGVEPQSETVWRQANHYRIPRITFVNKLDRTGANFNKVVKEIEKKFNLIPLALQLPIGEEENFRGLVDLVEMKALLWEGDESNAKTFEDEIPRYLKEKSARLHEELIAKVAEADDELLEKFFEEGSLEPEEIKRGIREMTLTHRAVPILGGSALKNKGVRLLLNAVIDYLPSPLDVPPIEGLNPVTGKKEKRIPTIEEPFSALAFKVITDLYAGRLTYFRVYSGKLKSGSYIYNSTKHKKDKVNRILEMHANTRREKEEILAGEIGAAIGLKDIDTGDSLCQMEHPIIFEKMRFAEPVIFMAIEPKTRMDENKLVTCLSKFSQEDPTFKVAQDKNTGQTIISGMGELHLDIILERLRREFNIVVKTGKPQVAYRETIKRKARARGRYIRQTGGRGQYGDVLLEIEPTRGEDEVFVNKIKGGAIPGEFISAIRSGVQGAMETGVIRGYPVINVKAILLDGSYHPVDSSEIAFKIAASIAFKKAFQQAEPYLLEPIMSVKVRAPQDFMGAVIEDITARRGKIHNLEMDKEMSCISAYVPLGELFGYITGLRSLSKGKAISNIEFSHYEELPPQKLEEIKL